MALPQDLIKAQLHHMQHQLDLWEDIHFRGRPMPDLPEAPKLRHPVKHYRLEWRAINLEPLSHPESWLIIGNLDGLGDRLSSRFSNTRMLAFDADFPTIQPKTGIIYLPCLAMEDPVPDPSVMEHFLGFLQWLAASGAAAPVYVLTRQAFAIEDETPNPGQAPVWGMIRTFFQEFSQINIQVLDVDNPSESILLGDPGHENQVAIRNGRAYAPRLVRVDAPPEGKPLPRGTWLISGGHRGFGLRCAHMLVGQGIEALVLLGRRPLPDEDPELDNLRSSGVTVHYRATDITDRNAVQAVFREFPAIRGIVHAASVWQQDGKSLVKPIAELLAEDLHKVFAPKIQGGINLHECAGAKLEAFISFGSGAALTGTEGQGNYNAANAWLDSFSQYRGSQQKNALTINWGAIAGVGFNATEGGGKLHALWESMGIHLVNPDDGLGRLPAIWASATTGQAVMSLDLERIRLMQPQFTRQPWARELFAQQAPLTPGQQQLWFLESQPQTARAHNEAIALTLIGDLDTNLLHQTWNHLVLRHEALRTRINPDGLTQTILPSIPVALETADVPTEALKMQKAVAAQAFQLHQGPLFRLHLARTGERAYRFLIAVHHIIADGRSMGLLIEEMIHIYNALKAGEQPRLLQPLQARNYAAMLDAHLTENVLSQSMDWWRRHNLPGGDYRPGGRNSQQSLVVVEDNLKRIKQAAAEEGATLFMWLVTAWIKALVACGIDPKPVLQIPFHGRTAPTETQPVGHFSYLIPIQPESPQSEAVRNALLDVYPHQQVPAHKRPFQADPRFALNLNTPDSMPVMTGLETRISEVPAAAAKFAIFLNMTLTEDTLRIDLNHDLTRVPLEQAKELLVHYKKLINGSE